MKKNAKKGFTLVELLVVIAILAILATVSVVGYSAFIASANKSNAETEAHQVEGIINASLMAGEAYEIATGYTIEKNANGVLVLVNANTEVTTGITFSRASTPALNADLAGLPGSIVVAVGANNAITLTYKTADYEAGVPLALR